MMLDLLRPAALGFLALLPLVWWWGRRSIAPLRGKRRTASMLLRCTVLGLLVLALAEPRWLGSTTREQVFLLVDRSSSIGEEALEKARAFVESADFNGAEVVWLPFAGRGKMAADLEEVESILPDELVPDATRLDTALGLAAAGFRTDRSKTVVLFSDGNPTAGALPAQTLADQGIRVHAVPVSPPDQPEVLVRRAEAPQSVREGEPIEVQASIQSSRAGSAEVDFFRNGVRIGSREVPLQPGVNPVAFEDRAPNEKLLFYEVAVRAPNDTLAENNQAGVAVVSQGTSKALLVSDRPESSRYLEYALEQEGIILDSRPAEGAPDRMDDLQNYDVVLIDNIPASALTLEQMELLRAYVRDFGGGLVMLGGDQAYGLGGYYRTPVEDLLPVRCDFQKEEETPSLGLSLVIDRSGSMAGEKVELAKAAAKAASDLLSPKDYISVIAFDSDTYPVVPIQSASNPSGVAAQIASITATGGTTMAPAMEEALRQLSASPAKLKHVILLTDGVSTPGPFYELASAMARNNITVSTVAVGTSADRDLLSQIARWGNGRFYETADPRNIPQIFTKETMTASKSAIQEFPFLPQPVRAVDFLEGVPWDSAPFLLGYVRTRPKPTSETWLLSERGDPLLSTWRFGLGTAAAFTSDARNRWAVEWLRWPGFGKFWSQLLRRLGRPDSLGLSELTLEDEGDRVRVIIDALDPESGFLGDAEATLQAVGPSGKARALPMQKTQPGRWEVEFPAEEKGVTSGQVKFERAGEVVDTRFFTHTRGYSEEYLLQETNTRGLEELASATGGSLDPDPGGAFFQRDRTAAIEYDLWPWLAGLALAGFVLDVALRRWPD